MEYAVAWCVTQWERVMEDLFPRPVEPAERVERAKRTLQKSERELRRELMRNEVRREDAEDALDAATDGGNEHEVRRAALAVVRVEEREKRLETERDQTLRAGDDVARMQNEQVRQRALVDGMSATTALQPPLRYVQGTVAAFERQKAANEIIKDSIAEALEPEEEEGETVEALTAGQARRLEELAQRAQEKKNQRLLDQVVALPSAPRHTAFPVPLHLTLQIPPPRGVTLSSSAAQVLDRDALRRRNEEESRRLSLFLAEEAQKGGR